MTGTDPAARRAAVAAMARSGMEWGAIADRLHVSKRTVQRDAEAMGCRVAIARRPSAAETVSEFDWLVGGGVPPESAAARLGVKLASINDMRARSRRKAS